MSVTLVSLVLLQFKDKDFTYSYSTEYMATMEFKMDIMVLCIVIKSFLHNLDIFSSQFLWYFCKSLTLIQGMHT